MRIALDNTTDIDVTVRAQVWPFTLPPLQASFGTVFNFPFRSDADGATDLAEYYPRTSQGGVLDPAVQAAYFDTLCDARVPADDPYLVAPRPIEDYVALAACGAKMFNLLDVSRVAGNGTMLTNYTSAQIDTTLELLEPTVAKLTSMGLIDRAYVYGFDERPGSYAGAIAQLFGAVKARFPRVRTMAVLRWAPEPSLPIDIWVNLYSLFDEGAAAAFRASGAGREAWAYHCISPRPSPPTGPMPWLNTFVELPISDARLLGWWSFGRADGWLYYLVNGWGGVDDGPQRPRAHRTLALLPGSSTRTNFSAVRYNAAAVPGDKTAFSNGDGILIYPGCQGPLSSLRLEAFRDGLEDLELLRALERSGGSGAAGAHAAAQRVITGFVPAGGAGADAGVNVSLVKLEASRVEAATALVRYM